VSDERDCNLPVRQWTTHDEVIVAMHQDTDHDYPTSTKRGSGIG
jgi:hypothetical protein